MYTQTYAHLSTKRKRLIVSDPLVAQSSEGGGSSKEVLLVNDLDLLVDHFASEPIDHNVHPVTLLALPLNFWHHYAVNPWRISSGLSDQANQGVQASRSEQSNG